MKKTKMSVQREGVHRRWSSPWLLVPAGATIIIVCMEGEDNVEVGAGKHDEGWGKDMTRLRQKRGR
jgi:hypothetical protein